MTAPTPSMLRRLVQRLRQGLGDLHEIEERRALLARPWEEDFLHWARDDHGWQLHGRFAPPPWRHTSSVTTQGWCPGLSRPDR